MKGLFFSKQAKILVDILLILGFIILRFAGRIAPEEGAYWNSPHCIISIVWYSLMAFHVVQHWRLIRAFTKKKVIVKNKITAVTILSFLLMLVSIVALIIGMGTPALEFHNIVGHLFILIIIIHTVTKAKRFITLFNSKKP